MHFLNRSTQPTGRAPAIRLLVLIVATYLAGCATQLPTTGDQSPQRRAASPNTIPSISSANSPEENALLQLVTLQDRLDRVAAPLLVNNPPLCKNNARRLLGFTAKTRYSYASENIAAAEKLFGLDEHLQVTAVLPGSGAARVGVARGDVLMAVEDKPMPQGENAERQAAAILAPMVQGRSAVKLTVQRDGTTKTLEVPLTSACALRVELGNSDAINAFSDGHRVLVTRGMMQLARSDQELAYVLGREMAHDILGQPARLRSSAAIASVIDNLIRIKPDLGMMNGTAGIKPYPRDTDIAADITALYLVARGGYPLDDAAAFWRRVSEKSPPTVLNGYTAIHPSTAARLTAIDKTIAAIALKQADKKPLLP